MVDTSKISGIEMVYLDDILGADYESIEHEDGQQHISSENTS